MSFKINNKADAGRKLQSVKKEILYQVKFFNSKRSIPVLLCLEDAINNLELRLLKAYKIEKRFDISLNHHFAILYMIYEWYQLINEMINDILENGFYEPSTKIKLGAIGFGISLEKDYEIDFLRFSQDMSSDPLLGKKLITRIKPRIFLNKYYGAMFFGFNARVDKHFIRTFDKLMSLRGLYYQQGLLHTMIYNAPEGTKVTFGEKGKAVIEYPNGFSNETITNKIGLNQRGVTAYSGVKDWNSEFSDIQTKTLENTIDKKSLDNIQSLKREREEIFKAYNSLKGFPEHFKNMYGISLEQFFKIRYEVMMLCYPQVHTVGIWKISNILYTLTQKTGYNYEIVKRVMEIGSNPKQHNFIVLDNIILTNFRRLMASNLSLLNNCFDEVYENDFKGKAFEEACRELLITNHFNTLHKCVDVFEPMIPADVSIKFFGSQKKRTDIDVIGCKNNQVLVIECKEIKFNLPDIGEQNQFMNYLIEQMYRVKWISENFSSFTKYVNNDQLESLLINFEKPINFFPLVVTNRIVNIKDLKGVPLVSFSELKNLLSKEWNVEPDGENGKCKIIISGRIYELPCFTRNISFLS